MTKRNAKAWKNEKQHQKYEVTSRDTGILCDQFSA